MTQKDIIYNLSGIEIWGSAPPQDEIIKLLNIKQRLFTVQEIEKFKIEASKKLIKKYGNIFSQIMMPRYKEIKETYLTIDFRNSGSAVKNKIYPTPQENIKIDKKSLHVYKKYTNEINKCLASPNRNCGKVMKNENYFSKDKTLQKIEKQLAKTANLNYERLIYISRNSQYSEERAASIFILGWHFNKEKLIPILQYNFYDPDFEVQNNAALMLIPIIMSGKYYIPLDPIIDLLQMPSGTSRNKALALIYHLLANSKKPIKLPQVAIKIIKKASISKQLNHNSFAKLILKSPKITKG